MNQTEIHELAERLLDTRQAATEAEQNARILWDRARAISTRLREELCGNHHLVVLRERAKVLIVADEEVGIEDIVILDRASAESSAAPTPPPAAAPATAPASAPAPAAPVVTRAQLRDLCRDAAKTLGPDAVRGLLGGKVDAIAEADLAAKAESIRTALAQKGAA
jgi:hypothetical protein